METCQQHSLSEYVDLRELLLAVQHTFPTEHSLRWFIRKNRPSLIDHGAVIVVGGRIRFHPALFDKAVVTIGSEAVRGKHGG